MLLLNDFYKYIWILSGFKTEQLSFYSYVFEFSTNIVGFAKVRYIILFHRTLMYACVYKCV